MFGVATEVTEVDLQIWGPAVPNSRAHEIWGDGFKFHGCEPEAWVWSIQRLRGVCGEEPYGGFLRWGYPTMDGL